ncbi:MAG: hypothetical protein AAF340_07710 [Pseudomonadota bacterium]
MRFVKYMFFLIFGIGLGFAFLGLGYVAYVIYQFSDTIEQVVDRPSRAERIALEREAYLRDKAEGWTVFCAEYDCNDIPEGYVVKSIAGQFFNFPNWDHPAPDEKCRVTTDSRDQTQLTDGVFRRGASLDRQAFAFYSQCGTRSAGYWRYFGDKLRLHKGSFFKREPSFHYTYHALTGENARDRPTYASRRALLEPATISFSRLKSDDPDATRKYLSTQRLFQGRYVVMSCGDRCEVGSVSFAEDADLTTIHFQERIEFSRRGRDCELYEAQYGCVPDWEGHLEEIARYIRFVDQAVDAARRPPLPGLQ